MSEPVANAGKRPAGTLESDAGKRIGGTATLACHSLREDHRRIEAYLDRLLAVLQHLSVERIPEVQSIVGGISLASRGSNPTHGERVTSTAFWAARCGIVGAQGPTGNRPGHSHRGSLLRGARVPSASQLVARCATV